MKRRDFIAGFAGSVAAWPLAARAQQSRTAKIGHLVTGSLQSADTRVSIDALRQGLRELGYVEGQNIIIERRSADARIERLPALAAELVDLKVDVIVAGATPAGRAAQQATGTIPIIVSAMGDPVQDGLAHGVSPSGVIRELGPGTPAQCSIVSSGSTSIKAAGREPLGDTLISDEKSFAEL
jgi:ABC-type uncharacterized transport system substrate-binding protein